MKTLKQIVILLGLVLLIVAMALGFLTLAQVSVAGLLWLAGCALILTDIAEITMGKPAIKRDVRAAREIRHQIEQQAQEIRAVRDQVELTEGRVAQQAESIRVSSEKIAESEAQVAQTRDQLRILKEKLIQVMLSMVMIDLAGKLHERAEQEEQRQAAVDLFDKSLASLGEVTEEVGVPEERLAELAEEVSCWLEQAGWGDDNLIKPLPATARPMTGRNPTGPTQLRQRQPSSAPEEGLDSSAGQSSTDHG